MRKSINYTGIVIPAALIVLTLMALLLINQVRALAGGVTSLDAPAYPVTIDTAGSYRLTGNLTVPAGTIAIYVTADNVSLDLNGFTVRGPNSGVAPCTQVNTGNGIVASIGTKNTTVMNGNVVGFEFTGISLYSGARVERMRVQANCNVGIDVREDSFLSENQVSHNAYGIVIGASSFLAHNVAFANDEKNLQLILPPASEPAFLFETPELRATVSPTIPQEQYAATGTDTFAADIPTVIGD